MVSIAAWGIVFPAARRNISYLPGLEIAVDVAQLLVPQKCSSCTN